MHINIQKVESEDWLYEVNRNNDLFIMSCDCVSDTIFIPLHMCWMKSLGLIQDLKPVLNEMVSEVGCCHTVFNSCLSCIIMTCLSQTVLRAVE